MKSFPEILKDLRTQKGITQEGLANALGMTKGTIYRYESGKRKPDFLAMTKIEKFFGVSASYLRGEVDKNDFDSIKEELSDSLSYFMDNAEKTQIFLKNLPQEESLETFTALNLLYLLIINSRIKQDDYLFYIQTIEGIIAELQRYVEMMGKVTPDKSFNLDKMVNSYSESIKRSLIDIAELFGFRSNLISSSTDEEIDKTYIPLISIPLTQHPGRINREQDKKSPVIALEVLKDTATGLPIMICETRRGAIQVNAEHAHKNAFLVHVQGDSMINAGINDGDYVVIQPKREVKNGEIALVGINEESTIKYFYKHTDGIELRSANPEYESYFYDLEDDIVILGKVIDIIPKEKAIMGF